MKALTLILCFFLGHGMSSAFVSLLLEKYELAMMFIVYLFYLFGIVLLINIERKKYFLYKFLDKVISGINYYDLNNNEIVKKIYNDLLENRNKNIKDKFVDFLILIGIFGNLFVVIFSKDGILSFNFFVLMVIIVIYWLLEVERKKREGKRFNPDAWYWIFWVNKKNQSLNREFSLFF